MEAMALIEIDGLPINSMVIFHGYVSHNRVITRGYLFWLLFNKSGLTFLMLSLFEFHRIPSPVADFCFRAHDIGPAQLQTICVVYILLWLVLKSNMFITSAAA